MTLVFWIIVALALATVVGTFIYWVREEGFAFFLTYFVPVVSGAGVLFVGALIIGALGTASIWDETEISSTHNQDKLVSLKTDKTSSLHGEFFLGTGTVNGSDETSYTYMYSQKDGEGKTFYRTGVVKVSESKVYESDTEQPAIDEYSRTYAYTNGWIMPFPYTHSTEYEYHFTVPKGSVVQAYQPN